MCPSLTKKFSGIKKDQLYYTTSIYTGKYLKWICSTKSTNLNLALHEDILKYAEIKRNFPTVCGTIFHCVKILKTLSGLQIDLMFVDSSLQRQILDELMSIYM